MGDLVTSARLDEFGVVRCPMPGDALGAALRGAYGEPIRLPDDMLRLLIALDRPMRGH